MEGNKQDRAVVSVEVERKTRYTQLSLLPSKHAKIKEKILTEKLKTVQSLGMSKRPIVRSITADNGSENTRHRQLSQNLGVEVFFAHPYASWEKGSVENMIGRMRYYIPKGTSLSQFSHNQIQWLENTLNNTPRKCLGWKTPNEAMEQEANSYKFRRFRESKELTGWGTSI
jgi:IS30 family transposase